MTTTETLRRKVKKYIDTADETSLRRINAILEIDQSSYEWWKDNKFITELDRRYEAMESGKDKGITLDELKNSVERLKSGKSK